MHPASAIRELAEALNDRGVRTVHGFPASRGTVRLTPRCRECFKHDLVPAAELSAGPDDLGAWYGLELKMDKLLHIDWEELFLPTHSIAEMIFRGTLMYVGLFLILRFLMKRQAGSIGIADILVIVVIADAAQNALAKEYRSITEGIVLVVTIVLWDYLIDWSAYRFPAVGRLLQPAPVPLIRNGKMIRRNMGKEFITVEELESQLRRQGIEDIAEVKSARMEGDGEITVIKMDASPAAGKHPSSRTKAGAR